MIINPKIKNLINFLAKPVILAIFISAVIIPFLHGYPKYKVKLIDSEGKKSDLKYLYEDLNNDGKSEKITTSNNIESAVSTIIYKDSQIIDQWNYPGVYANTHHHFFGDYDNNRLKEMYVFTCKNDSLFLWITEVFSGNEILKERFIAEHFRYENNIDIFIQDVQLIRGDNENNQDLFFATFSGFSYRPRKLFIYNIENDSLIFTPESASCFNIPFLFDVDNDRRMEFFGRILTFGNSPLDFPYADNITWLMAYDHDLSLMFDPIQVGIYPARVTVKPVIFEGQFYLAALYLHNGKNDISTLTLYTLDGKSIKQIEIHQTDEGLDLLTMPNVENKNIFLFYPSMGIIEEYSFNLDLINSRKIIPIADNSKFQSIDIDNDKIAEQIGQGKDNRTIVICRNDFSHPVTISFPDVKIGLRISIKRDGEKNELFLSFNNSMYFYEYKKNPMYYIQYAIFLGIFLTSLFIISLIARLQKIRAEQKYEDERHLATLQLNALENQLNPHFNLNILNSIGALYETQEIEKAQYYFGKYGKLLRKSLLLSGQIAISLQDEIEFVKNYLELEKLRTNFSFDYRIVGEDILPDIEIPKMLIHTFTENAVKHGIKHLKEKGQINIQLQPLKNNLKILISDNGIGREKARQYSLMSTGKGLEIVYESLKLYFQLKRVKISYNMSDIYDEKQEVAGTKIVIHVPF
ncbi:MAG: histidine kinase [Prolixibacteraceae bacterium]|jgi:hypothetical protein|nr:histidine kinase [Prolixibacteraceae bacterium]MBT6006454.1 histidine kinase [Prolixibacteraceae bacterium]MBT7000319.1 histidine kinase [Prolixibacteraceae bacterium]MBT7393871.1 histidine kinase [Prolixibacteraceae bacterium]